LGGLLLAPVGHMDIRTAHYWSAPRNAAPVGLFPPFATNFLERFDSAQLQRLASTLLTNS